MPAGSRRSEMLRMWGCVGGVDFDRLSAVDAGWKPALRDASAVGVRGRARFWLRRSGPRARSAWATLFPPGELKAALPVPSVRGQRVEHLATSALGIGFAEVPSEVKTRYLPVPGF